MPDQKIVEYIKSQLGVGVSQDIIRNSLIQNGWPTASIDLAFASLGGDVGVHGNDAKVKNKGRVLFITLTILIVVLIGGGIFFYKNINKNKIISEDKIFNKVDPDPQAFLELDFFKDDLKNKGVVLASDAEYEILLNDIKSAKQPVILNNKVYDGIELIKEGETYFIKPKDVNTQDKLEIITNKEINPTELLKTGDTIQDSILKIAYDNIVSSSTTPDKITEYLISAKTSGLISAYNYDIKHDLLYITYPKQKIPYRLEPSFSAESVYSIVNIYSDPEKFSQSILKEFEQLMAEGNILIIDSVNNTHDFLQADIPNIKVSVKQKDSFKLGNLLKPQTALASESLSNVVTPKQKKIYFFQSTNNINATFTDLEENKVSQNLPGSAFYPFYQNDYSLEIVKARAKFGESVIPEFYELMSDEQKDVLFLNLHGVPFTDSSTGKSNLQLQGERYALGIEGSIEYEQKAKEFINRVISLESKYGGEKVFQFFYESFPLSKTQKNDLRNKDSLANFKEDFSILNAKNTIGGIDILPTFFTLNNFPEKTITFFDVCYGGSFASSFKSKVFLATAETSVSVTEIFFKDLEKISKYLLKDIEAKEVKISESNIRNFNLIKDFKQDQKDIPASDGLADVYGRYLFLKKCASNETGLCSLKLYGSQTETVSVSPHIKQVDGNKIIFNTAMNKEIPADQVVQIKFDKACAVPKDLDALKPKWVSDNEISLSWMDKAYTEDWADSKGPFAAISILNDKAVSKESEIKLTGNRDCGCHQKGCAEDQCLQEPTNIEFNATKPKTNFIYVMPCITEEYYKSCKGDNYVKVKKDKDTMPGTIKVGGDCYTKSSFDEKAVSVKSYSSGEGCEEVCVEKLSENKSKCDLTICDNLAPTLGENPALSYRGMQCSPEYNQLDGTNYYKAYCRKNTARLCANTNSKCDMGLEEALNRCSGEHTSAHRAIVNSGAHTSCLENGATVKGAWCKCSENVIKANDESYLTCLTSAYNEAAACYLNGK